MLHRRQARGWASRDLVGRTAGTESSSSKPKIVVLSALSMCRRWLQQTPPNPPPRNCKMCAWTASINSWPISIRWRSLRRRSWRGWRRKENSRPRGRSFFRNRWTTFGGSDRSSKASWNFRIRSSKRKTHKIGPKKRSLRSWNLRKKLLRRRNKVCSEPKIRERESSTNNSQHRSRKIRWGKHNKLKKTNKLQPHFSISNKCWQCNKGEQMTTGVSFLIKFARNRLKLRNKN